jgi:hypothetical protein
VNHRLVRSLVGEQAHFFPDFILHDRIIAIDAYQLTGKRRPISPPEVFVEEEALGRLSWGPEDPHDLLP